MKGMMILPPSLVNATKGQAKTFTSAISTFLKIRGFAYLKVP